jgi:hypothetical protein
MELKWHRLWEMEMEKGMRRGASIFRGEGGGGRGGSTAPEVDDAVKSGTAAREAEDGRWHLDVEDDKKIGSVGRMHGWVEILTGSVKNMAESMRWAKKIGEGILTGQN